MQSTLDMMTRHATRLARLCAFVSLAPIAAGTSAAAHEGHADLVERLQPSVVSVFAVAERQNTTIQQQFRLPNNFPTNEFFERFFSQQFPQVNQEPVRKAGSGFIISDDGYIVTNHHVIEGASAISVLLFSEHSYDAELIGADRNTDIALLKIEADEPLQPVAFGDSDVVRVGESVIAIGNPRGLGFSVSSGIVSARNRVLRNAFEDFIQTDAAINMGNSGGPLFNMDGEVIGVNTAFLSDRPSSGSNTLGIGFSMASAVVADVVSQLKEFGTMNRGWLGVEIQNIRPGIADALGLDSMEGSFVVNVPDGPARDAGIKPGDVIVGYNGTGVEDVRSLIRMIAGTPVGSRASIELIREGKEIAFDVTLGRRGDAVDQIRPAVLTDDEVQESDLMGLKLIGISPGVRERYELNADKSGVLVLDVEQTSPAKSNGFLSGDIILEVDLDSVNSVQDIRKRIESVRETGRGSVLFRVERNNDRLFLTVPLEG